MALDLATIQAIAARKGNEFLAKQVNMKAQILASKALAKEKCEGQVRIVNVQAQGLDSVGIIQGGADYPGRVNSGLGDGYGSAPTQLVVRPVSFVGQVRVPFDSAELVSGKADSVNLVKNQFELLGANLGQQLGRGIISALVCLMVADKNQTAGVTDTQGSTTPILDVRGFRVGQVYDVYNSALTGAIVSRIRITAVTFSSASSCAGTVSFTSIGPSSLASGTTYSVVLPGSYGAGASATQQFTDLATAVGSGNLYGTAVSNADWSGNDAGTLGSTSLTSNSMREQVDSIGARSGESLSAVVMGRLAFTEFQESVLAGGSGGGGTRFFAAGDALDPWGKGAMRQEFAGAPVVVDDNCPSREVFFLGENAVKLGVWREISPLVKNNMAEVSQLQYEYQIKCSGMFNLIVEKRSALGRLKIALS